MSHSEPREAVRSGGWGSKPTASFSEPRQSFGQPGRPLPEGAASALRCQGVDGSCGGSASAGRLVRMLHPRAWGADIERRAGAVPASGAVVRLRLALERRMRRSSLCGRSRLIVRALVPAAMMNG